MGPVPAEQEDTCWSKGARIGRSGGHIVEAATAPPAATHRRTAASMEKAQPQQRRRLEPPLLGLSHYPTLAGAVRQLDGTGANGPRRPPAGAVRLRHAVRPGSWPMPEGTSSGSSGSPQVRSCCRCPCWQSPSAPCSRQSWSLLAPAGSQPSTREDADDRLPLRQHLAPPGTHRAGLGRDLPHRALAELLEVRPPRRPARPRHADGLGRRQHLEFTTRLPYRLGFDIQVRHLQPPTTLEAVATGSWRASGAGPSPQSTAGRWSATTGMCGPPSGG
jgi:hypothetical protein